ncbi:hypothetical protein EDB84DRAFT_624325 [Lactarius hengduanensis]|nr:hypothetical protein EDB84DRAFT_624325 [Lactarius hengduanensis]
MTRWPLFVISPYLLPAPFVPVYPCLRPYATISLSLLANIPVTPFLTVRLVCERSQAPRRHPDNSHLTRSSLAQSQMTSVAEAPPAEPRNGQVIEVLLTVSWIRHRTVMTLPLSDLRMADGSHSDMTSLMGTTWGRKRAAGAPKGVARFGCPECVWERSANAVLVGWLYKPSRKPPSSPLTLTPIATSPPGVAPRRAMLANSPGRS